MGQKLEWTRALGDAFLAQEPQVMETAQNLRQKAYAAGGWPGSAAAPGIEVRARRAQPRRASAARRRHTTPLP
ncbi:MAG: DUF3300 domain-containing protein [Burkholderiales bacterium]